MRLASQGITSFILNAEETLALIPLSGRVFLLDLETQKATEVPVGPGAMDARFSPDSRLVSYVSGGALYVVEVAAPHLTLRVSPLPAEGSDVAYGSAEYIAQEEMDRYQGYWWSPEGEALAFEEADSKAMERISLCNPAKPAQAPEVLPYPRAGTRNTKVRVAFCALPHAFLERVAAGAAAGAASGGSGGGVSVGAGDRDFFAEASASGVSSSGAAAAAAAAAMNDGEATSERKKGNNVTCASPSPFEAAQRARPASEACAPLVWFDLSDSGMEYLVSLRWIDAGAVAAVMQSRDQRVLQLAEVAVASGAARVLVEEHDPRWVNIDQSVPLFLERGRRFLWSSEASGQAALQLRSRSTGAVQAVLTDNSVAYRGVAHLALSQGVVFVRGGPNPLHELIFAIPLPRPLASTALTSSPSASPRVLPASANSAAFAAAAAEAPLGAISSSSSGVSGSGGGGGSGLASPLHGHAFSAGLSGQVFLAHSAAGGSTGGFGSPVLGPGAGISAVTATAGKPVPLGGLGRAPSSLPSAATSVPSALALSAAAGSSSPGSLFTPPPGPSSVSSSEPGSPSFNPADPRAGPFLVPPALLLCTGPGVHAAAFSGGPRQVFLHTFERQRGPALFALKTWAMPAAGSPASASASATATATASGSTTTGTGTGNGNGHGYGNGAGPHAGSKELASSSSPALGTVSMSTSSIATALLSCDVTGLRVGAFQGPPDAFALDSGAPAKGEEEPAPNPVTLEAARALHADFQQQQQQLQKAAAAAAAAMTADAAGARTRGRSDSGSLASAASAAAGPPPFPHLSTTVLGRIANRAELPRWADSSETVDVTTASGNRLHGVVVYPPGFDRKIALHGGRRYPVVVYAYAGPGHRVVQRTQYAFHLHHAIAAHGFVVVSFDGRGTPCRGREWEGAIHHDMVSPVIADQAEAIEALLATPGFAECLDPDRVGAYGWSFGGYFAAMAALLRPALYRACVAVAPVSDWSLYDTHCEFLSLFVSPAFTFPAVAHVLTRPPPPPLPVRATQTRSGTWACPAEGTPRLMPRSRARRCSRTRTSWARACSSCTEPPTRTWCSHTPSSSLRRSSKQVRARWTAPLLPCHCFIASHAFSLSPHYHFRLSSPSPLSPSRLSSPYADKLHDFLPMANMTHMVGNPATLRKIYSRIVSHFATHLGPLA